MTFFRHLDSGRLNSVLSRGAGAGEGQAGYGPPGWGISVLDGGPRHGLAGSYPPAADPSIISVTASGTVALPGGNDLMAHSLRHVLKLVRETVEYVRSAFPEVALV